MSFIRPVQDEGKKSPTEPESTLATASTNQSSNETAVATTKLVITDSTTTRKHDMMPEDIEDLDIDDNVEIRSFVQHFKITRKLLEPSTSTTFDPVEKYGGVRGGTIEDFAADDVVHSFCKWEEEKEKLLKQLEQEEDEEDKPKTKKQKTEDAGPSGSK